MRTVDDLERVVEDLLHGRWAPFDRVALRGAFAAGSDLDRVAALDRTVRRARSSPGLREGSRRAGRALIGVHVRLATPAPRRTAPGSMAARPDIWRSCKASSGAASAVREVRRGDGRWGLVWSLVSAAIRLDVIGHVAAQALLTRCGRGSRRSWRPRRRSRRSTHSPRSRTSRWRVTRGVTCVCSRTER
jgi:urease accessory protein